MSLFEQTRPRRLKVGGLLPKLGPPEGRVFGGRTTLVWVIQGVVDTGFCVKRSLPRLPLPLAGPIAGLLVGLAALLWALQGARVMGGAAVLPLLMVGALGLAIAHLLAPRPSLPALPGAAEIDQLRRIMAHTPTVTANLALMGDKRLLFSASGRSFVMYGIMGRSWVVLGDPIGPEAEQAGLVRNFLALCDRHGARPVFYQVDHARLPLYTRLGLRPLKLGEEARVALAGGAASLARPDRRNLRKSRTRAARDGCCFELVEPADVAALLPDLMAISASWLHHKPAREKRFSLGYFDAAYLQNFPLALVRCHGVPVAFGNLWLTDDRSEMMLDMMRRNPAAPYGTMDFLFANLMQWGEAAGFRYLNLGLSPLTGLAEEALPPALRLPARAAVRYAGRFYNFSGLRDFKAKFSPEWRPKYLVTRGAFTLPVVVFDVAMLVAGGLRGLMRK